MLLNFPNLYNSVPTYRKYFSSLFGQIGCISPFLLAGVQPKFYVALTLYLHPETLKTPGEFEWVHWPVQVCIGDIDVQVLFILLGTVHLYPPQWLLKTSPFLFKIHLTIIVNCFLKSNPSHSNYSTGSFCTCFWKYNLDSRIGIKPKFSHLLWFPS